MNRFKRVMCCLAAVMAVPMLFAAEPTISLTAMPRYPWNGLVDLAFTIDGDEGETYDTSISVQDVVGGTNLSMKTVYKSPGVKANIGLEKLAPGTYNWLWDAELDLTSLRSLYSGCIPTSSTVLFKNVRLDAIDEFTAVPCGKPGISNTSNLVRDSLIKPDGNGKAVQFAFSDDVYTKCVCVHFEQSGADVVGYVKWARYVSGTGREGEDFDSNSAATQTIATSESSHGYGLCKVEARIPQSESSMVFDRVVIDAKVGDAITYTVKFNANGGTGSMANETFESGVTKSLTANAFTRTGYTFQGWATTSTGAVVYSNRQSVTDLTTTAGGVVTLYAVWKSLYPTSGLKVYWPFDGNGKDMSGRGLNLTGSSVSYKVDRFGKNSSAAYFSGSGSLTLNKAIGVTNTMSISMWVMPEKSGYYTKEIPRSGFPFGAGCMSFEGDDFPMIIIPSKGGEIEEILGYKVLGECQVPDEIGIAVGKDRIEVFGVARSWPYDTELNCFYSKSGLSLGGAWHHVVMTINKMSAPVVYVDGKKLSGNSVAFNAVVNGDYKMSKCIISSSLNFGGRATNAYAGVSSGNHAYKGYVDDFMIYNRVLTTDEITQLYNMGK